MTGGQPAWRAIIDQHACPLTSISGADGVGSVLMGSPTVFINAQMACRQGDIVVEKPGLAMGPVDPILVGCLTVSIGGPSAVVTTIPGGVSVTMGGMTTNGSPDDVATFIGIISREMLNSQTFLRETLAIINDPAHPVTFNVGRDNAPWVDSFSNNNVDLNDVRWFEVNPHPNYPWVQTQGEIVLHFMVERHYAAVNGGGFAAAHNAPLGPGGAQQQYRTDRGQPGRIVSQQRIDDPANPDRNQGVYTDDSGNQMIIRRDSSTGQDVPYEIEYQPAAPTPASPGTVRTTHF